MRQILEIKAALEFARFMSPDIRDAVSNCIKAIASDMEEVEYEDSLPTIAAFRELRNCISEFENKEAEVVEPEVTTDEVDREPPVVFDMDEEVERAIAAPSRIVEDDDGDIED